MDKRALRDVSAAGKREARYGVFLNIHHRKDEKHVMLHKLPCSDYIEHTKKPSVAGTYTAHKDHANLDKAIEHASELSLNWHAGIRTCRECWKK